jgi:hypothetical protein
VDELMRTGLKTTAQSNALLDTMLFRYRELFSRVTTLREEIARERETEREDADIAPSQSAHATSSSDSASIQSGRATREREERRGEGAGSGSAASERPTSDVARRAADGEARAVG